MSPIYIVLVLVLLYLARKLTYWHRKRVPTIKLKTSLEFFYNSVTRKKSWAAVNRQWYQEVKDLNAPFAGSVIGTTPLLLIADPILINQILTKGFKHFEERTLYCNENDPLSMSLMSVDSTRWRGLRTKLTPLFTPVKLKLASENMVQWTEKLLQAVDASATSQKPLEIYHEIREHTFRKSCLLIFGQENDALRKVYFETFLNTTYAKIAKFLAAIAVPSLFNLFKMRVIDAEVEEFFFGLVKATVDHRKKNGIVCADIMQHLIQLYDAGVLTFKEVTVEAFGFTLVSFITTTPVVTFLLYELAADKELQEELREEIAAISQGKIGYESVMEMPLLHLCFQEILRKYPEPPIFSRTCTESYTIPEHNITIEKGTVIVIPVAGIHSDPAYYPNPEKFDPHREHIHPHTWIPFGEGPRNCIGMRLATIEVKMTIAMLLSKYRFTVNDNKTGELEFDGNLIITSPKNGIWLNVAKI